MYSKLKILTIAYVLLLNMGCAPTQPRQMLVSNNGDVVELGVMDMLRVIDIREQMLNSFLKLQFTIINDSTSSQELIYRIDWMDENGFSVGPEEAWKPELITGRGIKNLQSIAPTTTAIKYRIYVTSPNNTERPERVSRIYRKH